MGGETLSFFVERMIKWNDYRQGVFRPGDNRGLQK